MEYQNIVIPIISKIMNVGNFFITTSLISFSKRNNKMMHYISWNLSTQHEFWNMSKIDVQKVFELNWNPYNLLLRLMYLNGYSTSVNIQQK